MFIILVIIYIAIWTALLLPGLPAALASWAIVALSTALIVVEILFNWRFLAQRVLETFVEPFFRLSLGVVSFVAALLAVPIFFDWSWISWIAMFFAAGFSLFSFGIAFGANEYRKKCISRRFPWDLTAVYERSLNPNIRKTYGAFVFVIVPLYVAALAFDIRLLAVVVFLQSDNFYTRIRMTIPIAVFLTTAFEKSEVAWKVLKRASDELSIPGLVLDKEGRIPDSIIIQQDSVRITGDTHWLNTVETVLKYCRFVVFDTHSITDAVRAEINYVLESQHLAKVFFIKRPVMHPELMLAAERVERELKEDRLLLVEEIAQVFAEVRSAELGGNNGNALTEILIEARAPKLGRK